MTPEHWDDYVALLVDLRAQDAKRRFRRAIKHEWGCCAYCGRRHDHQGLELQLTIDHIRPRSGGGADLRSNLVPACLRCNRDKGNSRDWVAWFRAQEFHCLEREQRIRRWMERAPSGHPLHHLLDSLQPAFVESPLPLSG